MNFDEVVEHIVRGVEACGIAVLIVGGLIAFGGFAFDLVDRGRRADAYVRLRTALARVILLGLEILLLADIILTIVVEATLESVAILAGIVVIRIVLSFSLEVEIDGVWPWNRWRIDPPDAT
ncbi:MAG: DUF1622 domain-containing protein [Microthrixaceae bacterium]